MLYKSKFFGTVISAILTFLISESSFAVYNANAVGKVKFLNMYHDGRILLALDLMPATIGCTLKDYFQMSTAYIGQADLNRFYATLISAQLMGLPVSVGFSTDPDCDSNRARVFRVSVVPPQ